MATPRIDIERVAHVLADAAVSSPRDAAARAGITVRTISNYRKRLETDGELSASYQIKKERMLVDWEARALRLQVRLAAEMERRLPEASFHELVGAAKINGELLIAKGVLGGGQLQPDRQGPAAAAPPSGERADSVVRIH